VLGFEVTKVFQIKAQPVYLYNRRCFIATAYLQKLNAC